jgi:hypothetical protein
METSSGNQNLNQRFNKIDVTVVRTALKIFQFGSDRSVWIGKLGPKKERFGESRSLKNENSQTVCW